jgi:hypothetical protein
MASIPDTTPLTKTQCVETATELLQQGGPNVWLCCADDVFSLPTSPEFVDKMFSRIKARNGNVMPIDNLTDLLYELSRSERWSRARFGRSLSAANRVPFARELGVLGLALPIEQDDPDAAHRRQQQAAWDSQANALAAQRQQQQAEWDAKAERAAAFERKKRAEEEAKAERAAAFEREKQVAAVQRTNQGAIRAASWLATFREEAAIRKANAAAPAPVITHALPFAGSAEDCLEDKQPFPEALELAYCQAIVASSGFRHFVENMQGAFACLERPWDMAECMELAPPMGNLDQLLLSIDYIIGSGCWSREVFLNAMECFGIDCDLKRHKLDIEQKGIVIAPSDGDWQPFSLDPMAVYAQRIVSSGKHREIMVALAKEFSDEEGRLWKRSFYLGGDLVVYANKRVEAVMQYLSLRAGWSRAMFMTVMEQHGISSKM